MTIVACQSHVFPPADAELLTCNHGRLQTTGGDGVYYLTYWDVQRFVLTLADIPGLGKAMAMQMRYVPSLLAVLAKQ
jgi:hypothetical protein